MSAWPRAVASIGMIGLYLHDLRHTGNQFAAQSGAALRDLMARMGYDSERAAMIYLHGSDARQHEIADTLSKLTRDELSRAGQRTATQRARNRKRAS